MFWSFIGGLFVSEDGFILVSLKSKQARDLFLVESYLARHVKLTDTNAGVLARVVVVNIHDNVIVVSKIEL